MERTPRATSGRSFRSLKMAGMAVATTQAIKTTPKLRVNDPSTREKCSGNPVSTGEGIQAGSHRRDEETFRVRHAEDIGSREEDVEQDRPVGDNRSENLSHREPDGQCGGEAQDERQQECGMGIGQPGARHGGPDRCRVGREKGPSAAVVLIEELVRVSVLSDERVPVAVPARGERLERVQARDEPFACQGGEENEETRQDVVASRARKLSQASGPGDEFGTAGRSVELNGWIGRSPFLVG